MAAPEKVTVDKAYFNALLRRADFHTATALLEHPDPTTAIVPKVEYDGLLRISREFALLKSALFQGGITSETLDLLISGASDPEARHDSGRSINESNEDKKDQMSAYERKLSNSTNVTPPYRGSIGRQNQALPPSVLATGSRPPHPNQQAPQTKLGVPTFQRQLSFGVSASSAPEDDNFDEHGDLANSGPHSNAGQFAGQPGGSERRTLYLTGLSERATYTDLLSLIKGGKIVSVTLRPERVALVTLLEGAAEFLTYAKRNDLYLHSKRVEVKWADRQFTLNGHISNKIANGATRNLLVHNAIPNGLTEARIREDMDHIHNLVIVNVAFRNGNAYISTNSIHNALFARTCMLSRTNYKGCKIEFYRDECDVPLPAHIPVSRTLAREPASKKAPLSNRFGCLDIDDGDDSSDEENRAPNVDDSDEDDTVDTMSNVGVSLNFLDSEST